MILTQKISFKKKFSFVIFCIENGAGLSWESLDNKKKKINTYLYEILLIIGKKVRLIISRDKS